MGDDNDGILDSDDPDHPSNIDVDGDGIADDFDNDSEKPKDPAFLDCKISIYSKTYNRGDSFTLEEENSDRNQTLEIKDLDTVGFDNKLVSLQVSGGLNGTTSCFLVSTRNQTLKEIFCIFDLTHLMMENTKVLQ